MIIKTKIFTTISASLFTILIPLYAQELGARGVLKDSETLETIANETILLGGNSWALKFTFVGYKSIELVTSKTNLDVLLSSLNLRFEIIFSILKKGSF